MTMTGRARPMHSQPEAGPPQVTSPGRYASLAITAMSKRRRPAALVSLMSSISIQRPGATPHAWAARWAAPVLRALPWCCPASRAGASSTSATPASSPASRRPCSSAAQRCGVTCCRQPAARLIAGRCRAQARAPLVMAVAHRAGRHRPHGDRPSVVAPRRRQFSGSIRSRFHRRPPPADGAAGGTRLPGSCVRKRASSNGLSKSCVSSPANSIRARQRPACPPQTVSNSRVARSAWGLGSGGLAAGAAGVACSAGRPCDGLVCMGTLRRAPGERARPLSGQAVAAALTGGETAPPTPRSVKPAGRRNTSARAGR